MSYLLGECRILSLWEDEQTKWVEMESWQWGCHCWGHLRNGGCSRVCQVGQGRRGERRESKRTWSLWTIPWWWRQLTASRTERMTVMASCWVDFPFARIRSKALRRWWAQKRVVFCARLEALRDRRCWWGHCPDVDFPSKAEGTTYYWHTVLSMQKGLVSGLDRLRSEAQRSGERKSLKKCLMSQWLCYAKGQTLQGVIGM